MTNKEFAKQLELRTRTFAIAIIKFSSSLSNSTEYWVIRKQLTKSGTSIGANYREANRARSRADFSNRIRICESEASETVYWLEILEELDQLSSHNGKVILEESRQLLAIFSSIHKNLNSKL